MVSARELRVLLINTEPTWRGGEQQLLALARCLCRRPKLMLLDEPTEGIQPSIIDEISDTLKTLTAQQDITIVLVEQNLDFVLGLADRWAVLKLGRIDDSGTVEPDTRERILEHLKI